MRILCSHATACVFASLQRGLTPGYVAIIVVCCLTRVQRPLRLATSSVEANTRLHHTHTHTRIHTHIHTYTLPTSCFGHVRAGLDG